MINQLTIKNFKSIRELQIPCKRINLFIGEPNSGKSNILETLGLLSFLAYGEKRGLADFVRLDDMSNLFFDNEFSKHITIKANYTDKKPETMVMLRFAHSTFTCVLRTSRSSGEIHLFSFDFESKGTFSVTKQFKDIKFYRFKKQSKFEGKRSDFLSVPNGDNLLSVLMSHKEIKDTVTQLLKRFGYKLMFKPKDSTIEVAKEYDDVLINIPYPLISDTFQRLIFYLTAIMSNKGSVLVFEEPESHTFPYYTKFLAEKVALDESNQFFISTHNPYFLLSVLEKTKREDISVFITYMKNFETKVKLLSEKNIEECLNEGIDFFFNLDMFLDGGISE